MKRSVRGFALSCALLMFGCASLRDRPASADARSYHYRDNNGLSVTTTGVYLEQPVSRATSVMAQVLVDHVKLDQGGSTHVDDAGQATGHQHDGVDSVSSASISTTRGLLERETRYEGSLGASYGTDTARGPLELLGFLRVSIEPDYRSYAMRLRASWELAATGTTVTALGGYGHDVSEPRSAPPGEEGQWPATNERVQGGLVVTQVLTTRVVASGGLVLSHQFGRLESPYRRARVVSSLFPEHLPDSRTRATAFLTLATYLGWETALHARLGAYADTWGVRGAAPEMALARQMGPNHLLSLRYRFYQQMSADFYELGYSDLEGHRTGDARLGRIREHEVAANASLTLLGERGERRSLLLALGYGFLVLAHRDLDRRTLAHVISGGLSGNY